jgi:hypothetical protein
MFKDLFSRNGYHMDYEYDWMKQKEPGNEAAHAKTK